MQNSGEVEVSIIIVNYNSYELVKTCIDSIYELTEEINYEIVIVDNASTDQSAVLLRKRYPEIKVVFNEKNWGFGLANNIGVEYAKGEYLLFLNPDTYLLNNAIGEMYNFLKSNNKCLAVGCWLRDPDGNIVGSGGRFPAPHDFIFPLLNRIIAKQKVFKYKIKSQNLITEFANVQNIETTVDWIIGADIMLRKSHFIEVGGFDKDFFMYWEEVYLQYVLKKRFPQKQSILLNMGKIVHLGGGTTEGTSNVKKLAIEDKSILVYLRKTQKYIIARVYIFLYLLARCISLITRSNNDALKEYFLYLSNDFDIFEK